MWQEGDWRNIIGEGEILKVRWPLPLKDSFPAPGSGDSWQELQQLADLSGWNLFLRGRSRGSRMRGTFRQQQMLEIVAARGETKAIYGMLVQRARMVVPPGTKFVPYHRCFLRRVEATRIRGPLLEHVDVSSEETDSVDSEVSEGAQERSRTLVPEREAGRGGRGGAPHTLAGLDPGSVAALEVEVNDAASEVSVASSEQHPESEAGEAVPPATGIVAVITEEQVLATEAAEEPAPTVETHWQGRSAETAQMEPPASPAVAAESTEAVAPSVWDTVAGTPDIHGGMRPKLKRMFDVARARLQALCCFSFP